MVPRLGEKYNIEIETIDKPKDDYSIHKPPRPFAG
jgi:hypothetical protein